MGLQMGDITNKPLPHWPCPIGSLAANLQAGSQLPGLLPCVLKDTLRGQALGGGLGCPLSPGWAPTVFPAFMLPLQLVLSLPSWW